MSRDERQELSLRKWINNKGRGTLVCCTGYGKTRVATNIIQCLKTKTPSINVLIIVPTESLQNQWKGILDSLGLGLNCNVQIVNSVIKQEWKCDLLIIDEYHRVAAPTFKEIFNKIKYTLILGLTATFDRLDGNHKILAKYAPPVDNVTIAEALANNWVSTFKEYAIIIDVDTTEYDEANKSFNDSFAFFNYDFNLAMKMCGKDGYKARISYRDILYKGNDESMKSKTLKNIMFHATNFMRMMQKRKAFINNHPKKLEIARKIIESRQNKKIITFSNSIAMAEKLRNTSLNTNNEFTYSGKDSKKKGRVKLDDFKQIKSGVLHTIKKVDEGLDCPGLSIGIILGTDSSPTKAIQRLGRVCRKEDGKEAELFYIIIANTVEEKWVTNSHKNSEIIRIDENGLDKVLKGEPFEPYKRKISNFTFRY